MQDGPEGATTSASMTAAMLEWGESIGSNASKQVAEDAVDAEYQDYTRALELGPEDETAEEVARLLRDAKLALKKSKRVDYYGLLEVAVDASTADIKKAFRSALTLRLQCSCFAHLGDADQLSRDFIMRRLTCLCF